jgi:phenylpropionate dioxygenase-like ring-hydroxylating dioxygenase large terminal subunit
LTLTTDPIALGEWIAVGRLQDLSEGQTRRTWLLGAPIVIDVGLASATARVEPGALPPVEIHRILADGSRGARLAVCQRYGHLWASYAAQPRPMIEMPEFEEMDRRLVTAGAIRVRTSAQRLVENFLDMGHFPYVHTGILGAEPGTEVAPYSVRLDEAAWEVHATECRFFQPQAAKSAGGGIEVLYHYRTSGPFVVMLYKTCPAAPKRQDLIGLFIQPLAEDHCDVHSFVLVIDPVTPEVELRHFQQVIFLQDRLIVEQQKPRRLPIWSDPELSVRADASATAYRRWLRSVGMRFGCEGAAAPPVPEQGAGHAAA